MATHTAVRLLNDLGAATWFGGSLMGAIGLNGAAAHGGLAVTDRKRLATQQGVVGSTAAKTALTAAGLGIGAWSTALNRQMAAAGHVPVAGATEASAQTPAATAKDLKQLKLAQWLNPLVAGAVIAAGSWQSEQQRTMQVVPGVLKRITWSRSLIVPAAGALATGALAARRRKATDARSGREQQQLAPVVWHTEPAAERQPIPVVNLRAANGGHSTAP